MLPILSFHKVTPHSIDYYLLSLHAAPIDIWKVKEVYQKRKLTHTLLPYKNLLFINTELRNI